MNADRTGGVLLHPTSLPGPYGIGDIGPAAHRFVRFLAGSGCGLWQMLPHGPTSFGDSPYQTLSVFAGNPLLISPDVLLEEALLTPADLAGMPSFSAHRVEYGELIPWKFALLQLAHSRFLAAPESGLQREWEGFQVANAVWLPDFALFMALKEAHGGRPWWEWDAPLRNREPAALAAARRSEASSVERHAFVQFLFFRQWERLRARAWEEKVRLIGDIPIFVAHDSADVWANPDLFRLDEHGRPTHVAGVPPDYFSPTGQLWGNPLYNWEAHRQSGYAWWIDRFRAALKLVDLVRLDHFRGFDAYWEIPAGMPTAEHGRWADGPGVSFLTAVQAALGGLPLIAEDLGVMTPSVAALRDAFGLPGMRILQFAFEGGAQNPFLPHNHTANCVVYTGTHDNDTTVGWYRQAPQHEQEFCRRYLGVDGGAIAWSMIRAGWSSVARYALAPMQDVLSLDTEARLNFPGRPSGNWQWRMEADALSPTIQERLLELNTLYGRVPHA